MADRRGEARPARRCHVAFAESHMVATTEVVEKLLFTEIFMIDFFNYEWSAILVLNTNKIFQCKNIRFQLNISCNL